LEKDDNILRKIREILGDSTDNFSILEHQIDVRVQMEYFEFSRNHPSNEDPEKVIEQADNLYSQEIELDDKKSLLVNLASIEKPEAYRIIQRYVPQAPENLKEWASMALQESRMLLESRLLDEQQVFISTGLGGREGKLRYFVAIFSSSDFEFNQTQKDLINSEFRFTLRRFKSDVEEIVFKRNHASIVALVPLNVPVKDPFEASISECNSLGEFIQKGFIITNVKKLSSDEVEDILKNPPSDFIQVDRE